MAVIVKGADVASKIKDDIRDRLKKLEEKNVFPKLVMIAVGDDPANVSKSLETARIAMPTLV